MYICLKWYEGKLNFLLHKKKIIMKKKQPELKLCSVHIKTDA